MWSLAAGFMVLSVIAFVCILIDLYEKAMMALRGRVTCKWCSHETWARKNNVCDCGCKEFYHHTK